MAVVMNAGKECRPVHIASGVIHRRSGRVDEVRMKFVGKPLSVPAARPHHDPGRAPATTAANLASRAAGGGGE